MKKLSKKEAGFSLVEILIVIAMIGTIVAMGASAFTGAKVSAGKSAAASQLRTLYSAQQNYHIQNGRFANITELATSKNGEFGTVSSDKLLNGRYTYEMVPLVPTASALSNTFTMEANGLDNSQIIKFQINERASIVQLLPVLKNW
jgi:prepilin-type N-terminal cleavage/methylation domain-containing protein